MRKTFVFIAISALVILLGCTGSGKIKIAEHASEIGLYEPLFVDFSISHAFSNPFDQDEIKVDAEITTPTGKLLILPCFWKANESPSSQWEARFTPREIGKYSFVIKVEAEGSETKSKTSVFTAVPSNKKGLLSADTTNHYFLKFDNQELFRGLGLNVGWEFEPKWGNSPQYTFEDYFAEMAKYKANFFRMWICPWNFPIEWSPVPQYKLLLDEFADFSNAFDYSKDLKISKGKTAVTQTDENQLLLTGKNDQFITYKLDSVQKTKLMIFHKGQLDINDIQIMYSEDNVNYIAVPTVFSNSWDVTNEWKRVFLFSAEPIPQPAQYIKYVFSKNIKRENIKIAGIHINFGNPTSVLDCNGLGRFSSKNAERLDDVFSNAEKLGIYVMLAMGYHGQFYPKMDEWGVNDEWQRNPYNKKNGGPCEAPADFFSNPEAKKHYKDYLRYFVARWGYSPAIAVWEFWNEIDLAMRSENVPPADMVSWHAEMAEYLKSVDPYKHLVTTSLCCIEIEGLWQIKDFDFTQIHKYAPTDYMVEHTLNYIKQHNKAHVVGEYAIGWKGPGNDYPAEEYEGEFHNGMWRGLFTPVSILPLSWWWDYHMDAKHYYNFAALATAIEAMVKNGGNYSMETIIAPTGIEALMISSDKLSVAWAIRKSEKAGKTPVIEVPIKRAGKYKIEYLDTWENKIIKTESLEVKEKTIKLNGLDLRNRKDMAVLITSLN